MFEAALAAEYIDHVRSIHRPDQWAAYVNFQHNWVNNCVEVMFCLQYRDWKFSSLELIDLEIRQYRTSFENEGAANNHLLVRCRKAEVP